MTLFKKLKFNFSNGIKLISFVLFALLVTSFLIKGPVSHESFNEWTTFSQNQSLKSNNFLAEKNTQLDFTHQGEHLNCLSHSSEEVLIRLTKTSKTYTTIDLLYAIILEKKHLCSFGKTTQALDLSYEFIRMNIFSSKAHPPTFFI